MGEVVRVFGIWGVGTEKVGTGEALMYLVWHVVVKIIVSWSCTDSKKRRRRARG